MNTDSLFAASRVAGAAGALLLDRLAAGDEAPPFTLAGIDADWLTRALEPLAPGVRVSGFEYLDHHSGTTTRARLALRLDAPGSGVELPDTLFVKIAPAAPAQRVFATLMELGIQEVGFYRSIRPDLPVRAPRVYGAQCSRRGTRFALLLEDLAAGGARFAQVGDRVELPQARRMMQELARLHAAFWESPRFTRDLAWVHSFENRAPRASMERFITARLIGVALRRFADELPPPALRVARICQERREPLEELWARGPRTLVHGDCHVGNLFFEDDRIGFLDWQVVNRAPGMRDVTYFLSNSCPTELRREHERELIALYLDSLAQADVTPPSLDEAWQLHRLFSVYVWIAAAVTAAAGAGFQAREIGQAGLRRATRTLVDLESAELLAREIGD